MAPNLKSIPQKPSVNARRVVLVGGCFDFIHFGHIHFLTEAKRLGDHLLVALESDENVKRRKGNTRPIHTQEKRAIMLRALSAVDEVLALPTMEKDSDYAALVSQIKPAVIAITQDDPYFVHKQKQAHSVGASLIAIPKIQTPSTSDLAQILLQEY